MSGLDDHDAWLERLLELLEMCIEQDDDGFDVMESAAWHDLCKHYWEKA